MERKMYPVYCKKCKDKLLEDAAKDSSVVLNVESGQIR